MSFIKQYYKQFYDNKMKSRNIPDTIKENEKYKQL